MQLPSGEEIPLPPIILGQLGSDPAKKTVCIYGHLDVQPANISDGWDTEPFTLVEKDGKRRILLACVLHKTTLELFLSWKVMRVTEVSWNALWACKNR